MTLPDLSDFRVDGAKAKKTKAKVEWSLLPFEPQIEGRFLCFDQSVANTGLALIVCKIGQRPRLVWTGVLKTEGRGVKGMHDTLPRADEIFIGAKAVIRHHEPTVVLHEEPPVGGGITNADSSLAASMSVRCAAIDMNIPFGMVRNQTAKKRLTGNSNSEKKHLREPIEFLLDGVAEMKPMNEATRDAIAVGIVGIETEVWK